MPVESVWDYPRPPRIEPTARRIRVIHGGVTLVDTTRRGASAGDEPPAHLLRPTRPRRGRACSRPRADAPACASGRARRRTYDVVVPGRLAPRARLDVPRSRGRASRRSPDASRSTPQHVDECWVDDERVAAPTGLLLRWVDHERPHRPVQGRARDDGLVKDSRRSRGPVGHGRPARLVRDGAHLPLPPHLTGRELELVGDAIESNWIAPLGPHVDAFEAELGAVDGRRARRSRCRAGPPRCTSRSSCSGSAPGDEVACSTLTFAASANAIVYTGATPFFVDCDATLDDRPRAARARRSQQRRGGGRAGPRGDRRRPLRPVLRLRRASGRLRAARRRADPGRGRVARRDLPRRAPPAARARSRRFSFNGNKIITTSGGGMLVSHERATGSSTRASSRRRRASRRRTTSTPRSGSTTG